jgi:hypothetical protein
VFFSHNKSANNTFSHDFSAKRTGPCNALIQNKWNQTTASDAAVSLLHESGLCTNGCTSGLCTTVSLLHGRYLYCLCSLLVHATVSLSLLLGRGYCPSSLSHNVGIQHMQHTGTSVDFSMFDHNFMRSIKIDNRCCFCVALRHIWSATEYRNKNSAIQQCFSLTTNQHQHQPHKSSAEQGPRHSVNISKNGIWPVQATGMETWLETEHEISEHYWPTAVLYRQHTSFTQHFWH